jgi:hypothetical protein
MSKLGELAIYFLHVTNKLKIYHWVTKKYSRHIASQSLYESLSNNIDKFMETIQGMENKRLIIPNQTITYTNETDESMVIFLQQFATWLKDSLPKTFDKRETELSTIRDDMLTDVNKTLYLFSLN